MSDVIRFTGVSRAFGAVRAVGGLDLRIGRGETVALLGANGAGKSTVINLLVGLLDPTAGRVNVFGDAPRRAVAAGRIGAMLQDAGLMPGTTVGALVELACRVRPRSRPVRELLADAGLEAIARRRSDRLSGGQAQRVRFAMAIAGDPDLLLLDEPTAAMDVAPPPGERPPANIARRAVPGDRCSATGARRPVLGDRCRATDARRARHGDRAQRTPPCRR